jgi:hypothetical protein
MQRLERFLRFVRHGLPRIAETGSLPRGRRRF